MMISKICNQPICTCQIPGFQLSWCFTWAILSWFLEVSLNITFSEVLQWLHYKCSKTSSLLSSVANIIYSLGSTNHRAQCYISFLMPYLFLLLPGEIWTSLAIMYDPRRKDSTSAIHSHITLNKMHRSFNVHKFLDIVNYICRAKKS